MENVKAAARSLVQCFADHVLEVARPMANPYRRPTSSHDQARIVKSGFEHGVREFIRKFAGLQY